MKVRGSNRRTSSPPNGEWLMPLRCWWRLKKIKKNMSAPAGSIISIFLTLRSVRWNHQLFIYSRVYLFFFFFIRVCRPNCLFQSVSVCWSNCLFQSVFVCWSNCFSLCSFAGPAVCFGLCSFASPLRGSISESPAMQIESVSARQVGLNNNNNNDNEH